MTTEEEQHNLDDLVDYKDFDSGLESNSDKDSFNADIEKLYEDHKKKGAGDKTSEVLHSQRPISKYQRNIVSPVRREDENLNEKELLIENNIEIDSDNFFIKFNQFLNKFNIAKNDFIENPQIYFSYDEFKDLFKKIKFDISNQELNYLFNFNNSSAKDGYLLGQTFLNNFMDKIKFNQVNKLISFKKENSNYEEIKQNYLKENYKNDINFELPILLKTKKEVNEELVKLREEIMDIVTSNTRPKTTIKKGKILSAINKNNNLRPQSNLIIKNEPKQNLITNSRSRITSANNLDNLSKNLQKLPPKNFLKETLQKKKAEEEMVRLAIERKNREIERDAIQKMSEANEMAEKLGILKSFSAFNDEKEKMIICRIYYKDTKSTEDIELKKFINEWKKLIKLTKQKELTKFYKEPLEELPLSSIRSRETSRGKVENILDYNRDQRQRRIKEVLIDSLELKMKLKRQLKALRDKNLVDASIIRANLKLINLDDNNVL